MKLSQGEIADLRARLRSALENQRLTVSEVGRLAGVHPSQVLRIFRGEFRTISHNVALICRVLGVDPTAQGAAAEPPERPIIGRHWQKLCEEDPERARQMARLLEAMAELARS